VVELGPLGPVDPATGHHPNTPASELLNYWAHGPGSEPLRKPAAERVYSYVQYPRSPVEMIFRRKQREHRYVVRVIEDRAGRRVAHTERYAPEKRKGTPIGGPCEQVAITQVPNTILVPLLTFVFAVAVILNLAVPTPLGSMLAVYWVFSLHSRMLYAVERACFAKHLRKNTRDYDLPPLLSEEELDARVFKLVNPDEDHTFDDPAPIPMAKGLRDPAWKRWEDQLGELPDQEYKVGRIAYKIKQRNGFADGPDHPLYEFIHEIRREAASCGDTVTVWNGSSSASKSVHREDDESLRPLFESLGREVLGPERVAELEDRRRAAAHGEPMLDRPFAARTDCADGHVGEHPVLSTFTDSIGRKRVRRGCRWCPGSAWSELV
jgi:hypothetical protein